MVELAGNASPFRRTSAHGNTGDRSIVTGEMQQFETR
jgi:hypothetical protein